jgi:alginate O-acetyltransferase complex protein AlgI
VDCFQALFGVGTVGFSSAVAWYQLLRLLPLLLIAAIGAMPIPKKLWERLQARLPWTTALVPLLCAAAVLLCTAYMVDSTFSPFAYTQF